MMSALIEPAELAATMDKVKLLDASYADAPVWKQMRIGNAVFFDIDAIADPDSDMAHMLPSPEDFARAVSALGISNDDDVVVYDQSGMASAACRAWWMFRVFGHDRVRVLNGGLPLWRSEGYPANTAPPQPPVPAKFTAHFRPELVKSMVDVSAAAADRSATIIDARAAQRFAGVMPEPRPGLRAGHIPGSCNVPYAALLDPATGRMKNADELKNIFAAIPGNVPVITSCGSGVTACVLALGLYETGCRDAAVYDGSWTEWGRESSGMPVEK